MRSSKITPDTFADHRGITRSWPLDQPIIEYSLMITTDGNQRGFHYHPHFDEYMLVVDGSCNFTEFGQKGDKHSMHLSVGDSIYIPANTAHAFAALGDFKFVSLLTKRWKDCDPPIIRVDDNGQPI